MTDYFVILGATHRPALDEDALKGRFLALTAEHHPDVAGKDAPDFAMVNLAYQTLRDPRTRLRHLVELATGAPTPRHQAAPAVVSALFAEMGERKQAIDAFLKRRSAAAPGLGKALLLGEQLQLQEEQEAWLERLEAERTRALEGLPALDHRWLTEPEGREALLPALAEIAQILVYLDKWIAQIREALVKLQIEL